MDTNVSQEYSASIFSLKYGGSMLLQDVGIHIQVSMAIHSEDQCRYIHCHENQKVMVSEQNSQQIEGMSCLLATAHA
jgi:hypothetical protein